MDLRPQGPEIIRTWLFSTMLRSQLEHGTEPWTNTSINGWILDPDRKKMAKSKGNVVTPAPLLEKHGSDGVRYWALNAAPGIDTAIDDNQMKVGRRLALKLLNASRFVLGQGDDIAGAVGGEVTEPLDRAMLAKLAGVVAEATTAFEGYQYQRALERTETFFWNFCDDYLELVKLRAYGDDDASKSAKAGLAIALSSLQRMLAPFLPFAAEEAWSWWQEGSIHRAPWPSAADLHAQAHGATAEVLDVAAAVLTEVRKAKSAAKRGMVTPVEKLSLSDTADRLNAFRDAEGDVRRAGVIESIELVQADQLSVVVELQPAPPPVEPAPDA